MKHFNRITALIIVICLLLGSMSAFAASYSAPTSGAMYKANCALTIRKSAGSSSAKLGTLPKDKTVLYTGTVTKNSTDKHYWIKITYSGITGYVAYYDISGACYNMSKVTTGSAPVSGATYKAKCDLTIRKSGASSSSKLETLPKGATVKYTGTCVTSYVDNHVWIKITYKGITGYVAYYDMINACYNMSKV